MFFTTISLSQSTKMTTEVPNEVLYGLYAVFRQIAAFSNSLTALEMILNMPFKMLPSNLPKPTELI